MTLPNELPKRTRSSLIKRRMVIAGLFVLPCFWLIPLVSLGSKKLLRLNKASVTFKNQWIYEFYFKDQDDLDLQTFDGTDEFVLLNNVLIRSADLSEAYQ